MHYLPHYQVFKEQFLREKSLKTKQNVFLLAKIRYFFLHRKEVIHPHLPVGIPCYDFTPVTCPTFVGPLLMVRLPTSGITDSHGVTGGVYNTRERIHPDILIQDY